MLSSTGFLWDTECSSYVYFYIFIIVLVVWQVRQNYRGLKCEHKRSCCRRHQKVRQRARDAASRARRLSREEAEKPWELLSIMKSQSWIPKEGSVRQLLCLDPGCQICEAATLEIRQLLQSEKNQLSPALLRLPQGSVCLEMLPISSESFQWSEELYSGPSTNFPVAPGNQTLTHLTEQFTQSTSADGVQICWTDHLQVGQDFHPTDMPMAPETVMSSRLEESAVFANEEDMVDSNLNYIQQLQEHEALDSQFPFQTLNPQITHATHPMSVSIVTDVPQPFLSPEVLRLLELHVKKLMHFQRWGLPRRVEESLKQLMPNPPMYFQPEHNQPVPFILNTNSQDYVHRFGGMSPQTWYSYMDRQPIQTFWVSEWSSLDQRLPCKPIPSPMEKPLPIPDYELLVRDLCLLPKAQADDFQSNLQKKFTQLFFGLPSMHSESLGSTFLCTQGVSKDTFKPSYKDPPFLKELPLFPLPKAALPPSSTSPNESLCEHQQRAQIGVPFLTLSECKTLEWHLLQRQLQLQWGLPAVIPGSPYTQSHTQYKLCNKAKPCETLKASRPRKSFSVLTRELFFIPRHARRLLEFHLQKQLIHQRWGLPQRIQHSIHMLLSSPDQQSLSCMGGSLPDVSISQPENPEVDRSGGVFSSTAGKGSIPMPHLFAEAKAILKSHVHTKCEQIHKCKFPACVQSSRDHRIPGNMAAGTLFPNIPQGQPLELQAENNPDLHQEVVPWKQMDLDQDTQAFSGAFIEHCRRPQALSEETIKKLETTLRHKYLAFLSGLQALYCVAPTRAISPTVDQFVITNMPRPVKSPQKPVRQKSPSEGPCLSGLVSGPQDDNETSANIEEELQPGVQMDGRTEKVPPEREPLLNRPYSFNTEIMEKLNFHLKKKVLEIKLGLPLKANALQESSAADPESDSIQESLGSPCLSESTLFQEQPASGDFPPAPDPNEVHLELPATAVPAAFQEQERPSSRAVPHSSAPQGPRPLYFYRNMIEAQVHYVQMGTGEETPNLGEPFSTESQSSRKSKSSSHVPTMTGRNLGKPKAAGDLGEGDAGLLLSLVSQKPHQDGELEVEKKTLHRTPQGSSQQGHNFQPEGVCPHSPRESPELEFPAPPPEIFMEIDSEQDTEDSQIEDSIVLEAARIAEVPHSEVSQASQASQTSQASQAPQGLPSPCSPIQRKPFQAQPCPGHFSPGRMMPASPNTRPSHLPEAGLKNKMKFFLHSINPKTKSRTYTEPPVVFTPGKVAKTSKENVERGLLRTKSPTKKTRSEDFRGPKAQSLSSEKPVIAPYLTPSYILDSKFWPRSRQLGPVSVLGSSHYCPRHCPRLAYATQQRNPP